MPSVSMRQLLEARQRGMAEYGALAGSVGEAFERKWLKRAWDADQKALEVGDFSATTDLFQVVANVYGIKIAPLSLVGLALLAACALAPLLPVLLMVVPVRDIVGELAKFLF